MDVLEPAWVDAMRKLLSASKKKMLGHAELLQDFSRRRRNAEAEAVIETRTFGAFWVMGVAAEAWAVLAGQLPRAGLR